MTEQGQVLSWNAAEGHGMLRSSQRGDELFVHFSSIITAAGFRALSPGQVVEFQRVMQPGPNGTEWVAFSVRVVEGGTE